MPHKCSRYEEFLQPPQAHLCPNSHQMTSPFILVHQNAFTFSATASLLNLYLSQFPSFLSWYYKAKRLDFIQVTHRSFFFYCISSSIPSNSSAVLYYLSFFIFNIIICKMKNVQINKLT